MEAVFGALHEIGRVLVPGTVINGVLGVLVRMMLEGWPTMSGPMNSWTMSKSLSEAHIFESAGRIPSR